jgi:hypothetical protein
MYAAVPRGLAQESSARAVLPSHQGPPVAYIAPNPELVCVSHFRLQLLDVRRPRMSGMGTKRT